MRPPGRARSGGALRALVVLALARGAARAAVLPMVPFAGGGTLASVEGTGTDAAFSYVGPLAFAPGGTLFAFEEDACKVRAISPAGVTSTLAGSSCGQHPGTGGTGTSVQFPYSTNPVHAVGLNALIEGSQSFGQAYNVMFAFMYTGPQAGKLIVLSFYSSSSLSVGLVDTSTGLVTFSTPTAPTLNLGLFGGLNAVGDSGGLIFFADYYYNCIIQINSALSSWAIYAGDSTGANYGPGYWIEYVLREPESQTTYTKPEPPSP